MNKYKYFMNGMFDGTDGRTYEIEVPSPFLYDSELKAMKDGELKYRIILTSGMSEPELAVISEENIIKTYTYDELKKCGGYIRVLKDECKDCSYIDSAKDFADTDKTFKDIFSDIEKEKLYYVDNEAYCIKKIDVNCETKME